MDSAEIVRTIIAALSGAGVLYAANRGFKSEHEKNTDARTMALIDSGLEVHASALALYKDQLLDCGREIEQLKGRLSEVTTRYEAKIRELEDEIRILQAAAK